jgi:segregation and condensation protein A
MNITDLAISFQEILIRSRKRTQILKKETVSVIDKIKEFNDHLLPHQLVNLRSLLSFSPTAEEIVVTFLSALELSRLMKMRIHQEGVYSTIYLELLEKLIDFDLNLATGFDLTSPAEAHASA